jgi:hypothetical protein
MPLRIRSRAASGNDRATKTRIDVKVRPCRQPTETSRPARDAT